MNIKKKSRKDIHFAAIKARGHSNFYIYTFVLSSILVFFLGLLSYINGLHYSAKDFLGAHIFPFLNEVVNNLAGEILLYTSNNLETLYVDIPFDSLQTLEKKREEALDLGILFSTDEDYVSAEMHLNKDDSVDVKLRLKGDWTDHLEGEKWSFRVHVDGDEQISGMTRFSIQSPETRLFINEWVFHKNLEDENVLTTRYNFVNVLINGEYSGIYAIEESFSEELIESQKHRQGIIIRFDEDLMWRDSANFLEDGFNKSGDAFVTNIWSADISGFRENHVAADAALNEEYNMAKNMLYSFQRGESKASEIFNVELMGKYFALCDFWHAAHSISWHNMRFYFNPVSGLLEPIGFDGDVFWHATDFPVTSDILLNPIFTDLEIRRAYASALAIYVNEEYINELQDTLSPQIAIFQNAMGWEYRKIKMNEGSGLEVPWDILRSSAEYLKAAISPINNVSGMYKVINPKASEDENLLELQFINKMIVPLDLTGLEINGDILNVGSELQVKENQSLTILPEDLTVNSKETVIRFKMSDDIPDSFYDLKTEGLEFFAIVTVNGKDQVYIPLRELALD